LPHPIKNWQRFHTTLFLHIFFANEAGDQQVHQCPHPLLHVLIPLQPLLDIYTIAVTVTAPELNGEKRRRRRGGMLSDYSSHEKK
jgi:hypothetical protein